MKDYNQLLYDEASTLYSALFKGKSLSDAPEAQRNTFLRTAKKELASRGIHEPEPVEATEEVPVDQVAQPVKPDKFEWMLAGTAMWFFIFGFAASRIIG